MRGLADAAGVTPMALYDHFSSKRDLLSAIAESVIGAANFDGRQASWRDQVRHCFETLRGLCLRHPGLPRLLEVEGVALASVFAPMDVTLRAFHEAGLDDVDGVRTYFLLIGFTLGQAATTLSLPIAPSRLVAAVFRRRRMLRGRSLRKELQPVVMANCGSGPHHRAAPQRQRRGSETWTTLCAWPPDAVTAAANRELLLNDERDRVVAIAAEVIPRRLAWQDGMLAFDGDTQNEAVAEVSQQTVASNSLLPSSARCVSAAMSPPTPTPS